MRFLIIIFFFASCKNNAHISNNYVLSSRFFHPRDKNDSTSTLLIIDQLKPNRIDWVYYENDLVLQEYKRRNLKYSLTLNPQIPDSAGYTTSKYRIIDYKGIEYVAPWMKSWKNKNLFWGCVNNPLFADLFFERSNFLSTKKPYALFVDDPLFNVRLKKEGIVGCFCKHCIAKYDQLYPDRTVDIDSIIRIIEKKANKKNILSANDSIILKHYEHFQEESVILFFEQWMSCVRENYPRMIFLTNNYNGEWNKIYQKFDGGIAELEAKKVNDSILHKLYSTADSLHKSQLFTIPSKDASLHVKLIEYNIKHQRETLLPWDIFIPNHPTRYFMPLNKLIQSVSSYPSKIK
ncbi:MAG: hypothetical protein KGP35_03610 [Bacteroidetes bacterium]|nr:hypothetical protein [Bacteroidota bacterium]